jgi:hypothetical protein
MLSIPSAIHSNGASTTPVPLFPGTNAAGGFHPVKDFLITDATGTATMVVFASPDVHMYADYQPTPADTFRRGELDVEVTADTDVTFTLPSPPAPPSSTAAQPRYSGAVVPWTAPPDDGGSPVQGYDLLATPVTPAQPRSGRTSASSGASAYSGSSIRVGPNVRSVALSGPTNGEIYTVAIRARNVYGDGAPALTSVTPGNRTTATLTSSVNPGLLT